MAKQTIGWACLWGIVVSARLLLAAPPSVLPAGARLDDERLGAPRTLDGYFPLAPVADAAAWPARREAIRNRVLLAAGLWPMPTLPRAPVRGAPAPGAPAPAAAAAAAVRVRPSWRP